MKNFRQTLLRVTSLCCLVSLGLAAPVQGQDMPAIRKDTAIADKIAGTDMKYAATLCRDDLGFWLYTMPYPQSPAKMFDNMYYLGINYVNSFAITTSQGIILIDSLENGDEADKYILDGLQKLGLNPNDIKYIIFTHGHSDHYGGAREIESKVPGIHTLMAPVDWQLAENTPVRAGRNTVPPAHDMDITDGQKLTLGDETITMYLTPGHTQGTISMIFPVKDHGVTHTIALFGGMALGNRDHLEQYHDSWVRFRQIERAAHAEGILSTHPMYSNTMQKLAEMRDNPGGPNPFLESPAIQDRFDKIIDACVQVQRDKFAPYKPDDKSAPARSD